MIGRTIFYLILMLAGDSSAHAATVYVHAGRLLEVESGRTLTNRRITVTDGRVRAVERWSPPPAGSVVVDWSRWTVLPGLIDCHTHIADGYTQGNDPAEPLRRSAAETDRAAAAAAQATLRAGFTTVRDVGVYRGLSDVRLRDAIAAGRVPGPRMLVAGAYITKPGGGGAVTGAAPGTPIPRVFRLGEVRGANDARAKVNRLLDGGADFVKLIATGAVLAVGSTPGALELTPAEMRAACDAARARNSYCIAHAHGADGIRAAIAAGARSIEHASLIDGAGIAMANARGVWLDMDIYDGDWIATEGRRARWPAEYLRKNDETTALQRNGFRRAAKAGAKLSYGTDAGVYPHGLNARQFAYMVRYGMTPLRAIRAATLESARLLRMERDVGSLTPGHWGDMIAVAGSPTRDVRTLERVRDVLKGGVPVS